MPRGALLATVVLLVVVAAVVYGTPFVWRYYRRLKARDQLELDRARREELAAENRQLDELLDPHRQEDDE